MVTTGGNKSRKIKSQGWYTGRKWGYVRPVMPRNRKRGSKLNILPGLAGSDLDLFSLVLTTADVVPGDPRLDRPPCVQLMSAEAWTERVSGLSHPDYDFGVAEAEGKLLAGARLPTYTTTPTPCGYTRTRLRIPPAS